MVPRAVLMKSGLVSVNTARQVNAAHSKTTVNARPMSYLSKIAHLIVKRPIHKNTTIKNSNINQRVNTVRGKNVNTTRPKVVVNVVMENNFNDVKASACWVWKPKHKVLDHGNPQMDLQDQGVIDSGCSRHMTGNMSYLTDYEEIDGGYVAFGGNPKGGKITGKERRNKTLIEAARTVLVDSKLPTTFWAEAVNTACYVQNKVLVVKPHNKTPYELFHGRTPNLSFIRPFGCPVTILNTIDHLGKFDGSLMYLTSSRPDIMFIVCAYARYLVNPKVSHLYAMKRIFRYLKGQPKLGLWYSKDSPFDLVAYTDSDYARASLDRKSTTGTKASDNAGQARKETEPVKDYILLPLWTADPPFCQNQKSSHDDGSKPLSDDGKKVDEDPRKDNETGTNEVYSLSEKTSIELPIDPKWLRLEDYSIFNFSRDDEDDGAKADMNNLDTTIQVSPNPTTRIHKDHPLDQVSRDLQSATHTKRLKNLKEHGFDSTIHNEQKKKPKEPSKILVYAWLFKSQEDPKKSNTCIEGSKLGLRLCGRNFYNSKLPEV
ncbi:retrovirus-related pol polyprotein from transposon TNT 1-94 [Tanacetum coccineum]